MKKHFVVLTLALLVLSTPSLAEVQSQDKACQTDADCVIIPTACTSCCPMFDMAEVDAVTKGKEQAYVDLGKCTEDHIKSCGVPECGLAPAPYPDAQCVKGVCTLYLHPKPGEPEQQDTVKGTVTQSPPPPPPKPAP